MNTTPNRQPDEGQQAPMPVAVAPAKAPVSARERGLVRKGHQESAAGRARQRAGHERARSTRLSELRDRRRYIRAKLGVIV